MKREEFLLILDKLNIISVVQHPDYKQDLAYDIDDVIEITEYIKKKNCKDPK